MSKINKIVIAILLLLSALPLLFTSWSFFPWHFGKTVIFEMILEIVLFVCLFIHQKKQPRHRFNYLDWSLIIFLLILLVTALVGENFSNSFWGNQARANGIIVWSHFGIFYFLLKRFFQKQQDWLNLLTVGFFAALLAGLSSVFQNSLPESWQNASGGGIIGNRAFLAFYLLPAIGVGCYLFSFYKNKIRWLFFVSTLLMVWILLSLDNRGSELGLIGGLLSFLVLAALFLPEKQGRGWARGLLAAIFIFFILLFSFPKIANILPKGLGRLTNINALVTGTGETRLMAWRIAWQGIQQHPVLGVGLGNYEIFFNHFYNPQFLKYSFQETVWDKPHNWLLEMGVSAGIVGLLSYLSIITAAIYMLLKSFKSSSVIGRGGSLIIISTLLAYSLQSLFLFETTNSLILWFIILAYISFSQSAIEGAAGGLENKKINRNILTAAKIILGIILIFLFLLNFSFLRVSYYMRQADLNDNFRLWTDYAESALAARTPFLGENAIFLAEKFIKFDQAEAFANSPDLEKVGLDIVRVLQSYSNKFPDNLSYSVWVGQVYLVLGSRVNEKYYQNAEQALLLANHISLNKQEVLFLQGRLYLLQKKFAEAIKMLQSAVAVAPDVNTSHWFLGLTYVATGDIKSGLAEFEKAVELGYNIIGDKKLYVLDLYAQVKDYDRLVAEYKKLITSEPENLEWYVKLATVYAESGRKAEALALAQQLLAMSPGSATDISNFIKKYKLK